MDLTTNLGLKKPAGTDHYSVDDFNENMDKIDNEVANKVTKDPGKGLSTNDYTNEEKAKVASAVPSGYTLPIASDTVLGGIMIGNGLNMVGGVLSTEAAQTTFTATITTTWTGTSAPYTQVVTVTGILATDNNHAHITPVYSLTNATAILGKNAWNMVSKAIVTDDTITFTCFEDKPVTEIPILIEVIR